MISPKKRSLFSLTFALIALGLAPLAAEENAPRFAVYEETFETEGQLPDGWKANGNIIFSTLKPFNGRQSLELQRDEAKLDVKTNVTGAAFPVAPGLVEFQGAFRARLHSPDTSFQGAVLLEYLDADGNVIGKERLTDLSGQTGWRLVRSEFEIPDGVAQARVFSELRKTHGSFFIDGLRLAPVRDTGETRSVVKRIELKTDTLGNMLFPGDKPVFQVTVKTDSELPADRLEMTGVVTDYWGAEQGEAVGIQLAPQGKQEDFFVYTGTLDFSNVKVEPIKYYDVRVSLAEAEGLVARETSSFIIVPESPNRQYDPLDVPFNARNWDNRLPEYFRLSDRLGIRQAGIWGYWQAEPPYKPSAPQIELCRELGMRVVTRTPLITIEHHRKNYEKYTDEVMRKGYQVFYEKFGGDGNWVIVLGNEPRPQGPTVKNNVHFYKLMYEEVKKMNPESFVLGTSVGPVEKYFKLGFHKYSDAVDFHTYGSVEGLKSIFAKYQELFEKYGHEQPIWTTETGLNSQGLSRRVIAADLVHKTSWFFALGGANFCWFGICYPDRQGKLRGGTDDSFNIFNGLYGNYAPRLDALAYYNMINGIGIKKFREHRSYEDGIEGFLFADDAGESFQSLWKDKGVKDVFVPLPGVNKVTVTSLDGVTTQVDAGGKGIALRLSADPVLLSFNGGDGKLAPKLEASPIRVTEMPESIVRGSEATVSLAIGGLDAKQVSVVPPLGWESRILPTKAADTVSFSLRAPEATEARAGAIRVEAPGARSDLLIPVEGQYGVKVAPVPSPRGQGAVDLIVRNNNDRDGQVDWKVALKSEIAVNSGEYSIERPQSPGAYFTEASSGSVEVPGGEEVSVRVPLAGVDPLSAYEIEAQVTDPSGRTVRHERYIGGFLGVPKAKGKIALDGKLDEADWSRAEVVTIDEERQFRHLQPRTSNWSGPEDLSAQLRYLWDDEYLYMAIEVTDDVFFNDMPARKIWSGDGIQLLVDPMRESKEKPGKYDYALGVGPDGPAARSYLTADSRAPAGPADDIKFSTQKAEDGTGGMVYEIAIPWRRLLPFEPSVGANLGMAVALNENDKPVRDAFMVWFGDLQSKEVETVGDLILTD